MKFQDVLIIVLLAVVPFALSQGWIFESDFTIAKFPISIGLIVGLVYFAIKCFSIFVATYTEQSFFRASVNVELNDVLIGALWGIVIFQYYKLDYGFLTFWLFIGCFIFIIGFIPGAVINKTKGIRLTKNGKWIDWSMISEIYVNSVFFGFQTEDGRQYPILANKVGKRAFEDLRDGLQDVAIQQNISIKEIPSKASLVLGEAQFEEDGDALDDFIAKIKDFILIESKGLVFSENNKLITWANILNVQLDSSKITIQYNLTKTVTKQLFQDDFNVEDWKKLHRLFEEKSI